MSTTDELLEEMLEDAEEYATPVTDDDLQFWIDEHLRVISIPKNGVVAGVEGDKNVNKIKFGMNRYYHGFDMSTFSGRILYSNAKGNKNYYNITDMQASGSIITFSWLVDADAVQYMGKTAFVVYLFKIQGSELRQKFFSTLATLKVLEGMEVDSAVPVEKQTDIIERMKEEISAYAEEVKKSLPADYTAMTEQVSSLKEDFDNLIADGDNLYNKENVLIGKVLKKEGIVDDKDWDLSEEITVMPDQKYSIKAFFFKKTASSIIIEQINDYGTYLPSIDIGLIPTDENSGGFVFSTGKNTTKIRVNTKNAYFLVLIAGEEIPKKYFSFDSKHRNRSIAYNDSNISICTNLSSNIRYKKGTLSNDGTINNVNFWGLCTYDYIPVKKGSIITGNLNYSDSTMAYQVCEYSEPNENKFYIHSGYKTKAEKYVVSQNCYIRIAVYDYNGTIPARIDFFDRIQIGLLIDDLQKVEYENTIQISRQSNTSFYINPLIPDFSSCSPSSEKKFNLFSQNTGYQEFISAWRELCKTDSEYATYKIMGSDASKTYDVYKMSLNEAGIYKNDNGLIVPREKSKILIISGVHGFEKASCFALYYFVRELIESNNEIFDYLRYNIDFEIVPVANPWGFENLSYRQSENININRDSDYRWEKNSDIGTGDKPYSAVETTYLRDFIKKNYDAMLMIDWHTTGAVDFRTPDYTNWISDNLLDFPNENVLIANIAHTEYISRYINQKYNLGYKKGILLGKLTHEMTSGCTDAIACGIGVHGLCFEVSPKTENGNVHDETVAKMNTELFTHYLMTVIKQFQKNN